MAEASAVERGASGGVAPGGAPGTAGYEPRIVTFLCHYCAFAAADMAGVMRLQYPPNIRIIRLPCTGKLDVLHVMRAFEEGADGVMVAGCEEGSCHYMKGNLVAKRRVNYAKKLLERVGIEPERLHMYNLSSSMGPRFAQYAREMIERVKALGKSPLRPPAAQGGVPARTRSAPERGGSGGDAEAAPVLRPAPPDLRPGGPPRVNGVKR